MPREMVLRLNGGGGKTASGAVDLPVAVVVVAAGVVVVVVVVPVGEAAAVVVLLGETSGEKMEPSANDVRSNPYVFARSRSTSRISMSNTSSARGLSF